MNGNLTGIIKILRGMKQGDALSCAIFIICVDPLIRNINADLQIQMIKFTCKISKEDIGFKAGAFADDVGVLCGGNQLSIRKVFEQYGKLTRRSGLVLNADKTEILVLSNNRSRSYEVDYDGRQVDLGSIS